MLLVRLCVTSSFFLLEEDEKRFQLSAWMKLECFFRGALSEGGGSSRTAEFSLGASRPRRGKWYMVS